MASLAGSPSCSASAPTLPGASPLRMHTRNPRASSASISARASTRTVSAKSNRAITRPAFAKNVPTAVPSPARHPPRPSDHGPSSTPHPMVSRTSPVIAAPTARVARRFSAKLWLMGCRLSRTSASSAARSSGRSESNASGLRNTGVSSVSVPVLSKTIFRTRPSRAQSPPSRTNTPRRRSATVAISSAKGKARPIAQGQETTSTAVTTAPACNASPVAHHHARPDDAAITRMPIR